MSIQSIHPYNGELLGRELGTLGIKEFINEKLIRSFDADQNALQNPETAKVA